METRLTSAPWMLHISWEELATLSVCLAIDVLEIMSPVLMIPLIGDLIDLIGFLFTAVYFNWVGVIALFELIPGMDPLPFFTLSWLVWYVSRRRRFKKKLEENLEDWK